MDIERTGINEPPVVEELLQNSRFQKIGNGHLESREKLFFLAEPNSPYEVWILYGELELTDKQGSPILLAGDRFRLEPDETVMGQAGASGCGFITGNQMRK